MNVNDLTNQSTIKISVTLTIEVDPREWARANLHLTDRENSFTAADVRKDVRSFVLTVVRNLPMMEETGATVLKLQSGIRMQRVPGRGRLEE